MRKEIIGIVGGGQLGRMSAEAAFLLGFRVVVLDPTKPKGTAPAAQVGASHIVGGLTDEKLIRRLAKRSDYLTWEIEHINTEVLQELLDSGVKVNPHPATLATIKDKLAQKEFLTSVGIPVAPFRKVDGKDDVVLAAKELGYPLVLKTRFGGYDGRGNAVIKNEKGIEDALQKLGYKNLYAEGWIEFEKELAVIATRDIRGNIAVYPVVETEQKNNICHIVIAPARITKRQALEAEKLGRKTLEHLQGAGVFALEMFLTKTGKVIVNEIAPRVHNSGHLTIEACETSQFTQHILAITGRELGSTSLKYPAAVMVNILADRLGPAKFEMHPDANKIPNLAVHIYGKADSKPERKMGHLTVVGDDLEEVLRYARKARSMISI